ncbi:MAG: hypothetical protein IPG09_14225 [Ignavibacteria bacterium]|nr:hypothetical protein [Ignavibacteria bacterium]
MRFKIKLKLTGITKYMFKKPDRKILTVILLAACFISANSKGYSQSRTTIKDVNEALSLAMKNNSEIVKQILIN